MTPVEQEAARLHRLWLQSLSETYRWPEPEDAAANEQRAYDALVEHIEDLNYSQWDPR